MKARRWYEQPARRAERRAMRLVAVALLALWLLMIAAIASANGWAIVVEHTYDGPLVRVDAEMTALRYTGGMLVVEVVDRTRDGIFRSNFDGPARFPPAACIGRCE